MEIKTAQDFAEFVGNRFFTVKFIKKDGSERVLNGRLGVSKYVKGTDKRSSLPEDLVIVYDQQKEAYRSFRLDTLLEVKAGGKVYSVQKEI